MRNKILKTIMSVGCFAAVLLASGTANAIPTHLGTYTVIGAANPRAQLDYLNGTVLPSYPSLPQPATYGTDNIETSDVKGITLDLGAFDYIKLKWGTSWQYYYLGGGGYEWTFNSPVQQGLSHYTYFSPVADGGVTIALLGLGLLGVGFLRRQTAQS